MEQTRAQAVKKALEGTPFASLADDLRGRWQEIRKRVGGGVMDAGLRGVSRIAALHPLAKPERYGIEITRDIGYGGEQRMDIYRPRSAVGNAAPILYLHGGGFRILSKDTHWGMALSFAHRGHVVFVPNYRLAPAHPFPAGAEDACRAALWVASHAREYGADPARLVLAGESAGANLSLVVAIARSWQRPEPWARELFDADLAIKGLLPACGMLQVSDPPHRGTPTGFVLDRMNVIANDYLPPGLDARSRELVDVVSYLECAPPPERPLPPLFAICGGGDPVGRDTKRVVPAWQRHGAEAANQFYGDAIHAFHAFVWTPLARAAWADQHAFLVRVLT